MLVDIFSRLIESGCEKQRSAQRLSNKKAKYLWNETISLLLKSIQNYHDLAMFKQKIKKK
jgi:hypothetical protein